MILFYKDWVEKHPGAIIDIDTKNKSFVRLAALYKEMGIKNHAFILTLINPKLKGIDPHDPNLSVEEMAMVVAECKMNFWYYLREVVRVPSKSGNEPIMYKANRGNIALFWLFFNHITTLLIQIRQTGKSLSTSILYRYLLNVACVNTYMCLITKDEPLRAKTIMDIRDVEEELPFYLQLTTKNDIKNTEMLTVKSLHNTFRGYIAQSSKKAANNVGRGLTSPLFWFDEGAFLKNISITMPAALAAGAAARDLAKSNNQPWGTLITTTAGKKDDPDGRFIYNMLINSSLWTEHFFDADSEIELEKMIRKNSPKGEYRVNCTFNHRQLGYTDEWLMKTLEESEAYGEDADRDFFNVWTSGTASSPLPLELLEKIKKSTTEPVHTEIDEVNNYITRWYVPEETIRYLDRKTHMVMALDTSDAVGNDDIAMVVIDIKTGETLASGNYNETNLISFAEWIVKWLERFNNLTIIIERRSSGVMLLDYLIRMLVPLRIDPYKRLFNWVVNDADEHRDRYTPVMTGAHMRDPDIIIQHRKLFGFATSGSGRTSRKSLYGNTLINSAKYIGDVAKDRVLVDQIMGLQIRNGRVDHAEGGHDDMVVAWLLAYWFITNGKNLKHYNIDPRLVLSNNYNIVKGTGIKSIEEKRKNIELSKKITETIEQINNTKDHIRSKQLEVQLINLLNKITDKTTVSVDELMEDLKDKRLLNLLMKRR